MNTLTGWGTPPGFSCARVRTLSLTPAPMRPETGEVA